MTPLTKFLISLTVSAVATVLFCLPKGKHRLRLLVAMLFSTAGDFFMVNIPKLENINVYIGAGLFITAHIFFGEYFRRSVINAGGKYKSSAFFVGLSVMAVSVAVIGVLAFTVPEKSKPVLFLLILVYISAIGYNLVSSFSFGAVFGGVAMIVPVAVALFYLTDIFIFFDMLDISHSLRQYVWYIYPLAQLTIQLFSTAKTNKKEGVI